MSADHFLARIAHGANEVVVDVEHLAVEIQLEHGLRAMDGGDLTSVVRIPGIAGAKRILHFMQ